MSANCRVGIACLLALPSAAVADTAPPWTASFGRLVDPAPLQGAADAFETASPPRFAAGRAQALACLADAIAYEAANEPAAGQAAVAEVVLNRVAHPAFPKSVCEVVYQGAARRTGCQFSFTCDGSLRRPRTARTRAAALLVAAQVYDRAAAAPMGGATHYHANYVSPYWAPSLVRVATIGAHIFYRFPGRAATAPAPAARESAPSTAPVFRPWGLSLPPVENFPGAL